MTDLPVGCEVKIASIVSPDIVLHYNKMARGLQNQLQAKGTLITWRVLDFDEYVRSYLLDEETLKTMWVTPAQYSAQYYAEVVRRLEIIGTIHINQQLLMCQMVVSLGLMENTGIDVAGMVISSVLFHIVGAIRSPNNVGNWRASTEPS